ncbi:hypothetical protein DL96DRAFT_1252388 [Flagelloscypha sp. PMI_526]|nr:hypothetical protein DL96DRAFT_1252388 [Flagelloscypha sp. PMI_526]
MSFRRIPRLTLFTGTNCSLCVTAKEELAKVKVRHPFELSTVNIHELGNESWKKKYVYWIPALHIEGKEVLKGRWGEELIEEALTKWHQDQDQTNPTKESSIPPCSS